MLGKRGQWFVSFSFFTCIIGITLIAVAFSTEQWIKFPISTNQGVHNPPLPFGDLPNVTVVTSLWALFLARISETKDGETSNNIVSFDCDVNVCFTNVDTSAETCARTPISPLTTVSCDSFNTVRIMSGLAILWGAVAICFTFPSKDNPGFLKIAVFFNAFAGLFQMISFAVFQGKLWKAVSDIGTREYSANLFISAWPILFLSFCFIVAAYKSDEPEPEPVEDNW